MRIKSIAPCTKYESKASWYVLPALCHPHSWLLSANLVTNGHGPDSVSRRVLLNRSNVTVNSHWEFLMISNTAITVNGRHVMTILQTPKIAFTAATQCARVCVSCVCRVCVWIPQKWKKMDPKTPDIYQRTNMKCVPTTHSSFIICVLCLLIVRRSLAICCSGYGHTHAALHSMRRVKLKQFVSLFFCLVRLCCSGSGSRPSSYRAMRYELCASHIKYIRRWSGRWPKQKRNLCAKGIGDEKQFICP